MERNHYNKHSINFKVTKKLLRVAFTFVTTCFLMALSVNAHAELRWNVFGTIGFGKIDDQDVVVNASIPHTRFTESWGGKDLTRLGIQPSYTINEKATVTLQAVSRQSEDYKFELEWGYLNYELSDNATLQLGLMRRPLFHYSDTVFVGYGYRWVQPPSVAYIELDELYGNIGAVNLRYNGVFANWLYSTELYLGSGSGEGKLGDLNTSNTAKSNVGAILNVEQDNYSLRFGAHHANFSIKIDELQQISNIFESFGLSDLVDEISLEDKNATFYSVAGSYLIDDWEFFGEYVFADVDGTYIPDLKSRYIGVERRFGDIAVNFTIGDLHGDPDENPSASIYQAATQIPDLTTALLLQQAADELVPIVISGNAKRLSQSIGLRYDFHPSVALKAEYERITDQLDNESANIISISMDFVY